MYEEMMWTLMLILMLLFPFHSICFCSGCEPICLEPMTSTLPLSPCGCVFPMKVQLCINLPVENFFSLVKQLAIEIARGVYMEQSQVTIVGATADTQNPRRTVVNISLVPLGQKFDNTTASLTYEKFKQKKIPLNINLFGHYMVLDISYPGFSLSPSSAGFLGSGPTVSPISLPISANVLHKNEGINTATIYVIVLSGFILSLFCVGSIFILVKWNSGRPANPICPLITSSTNNKSGIESVLSSSMGNSSPRTHVSTMSPFVLSVKTFLLAEVEKATNMFSSKKILGEGGFGVVYHGILEGGVEVAVKLLTRDSHNRDEEFFSEVEMLSRLHHRNLVKLLGICVEGRTRCLIYELVRNGSVESHLHGEVKKKTALEWDARLKIALGSARGLAYLHEDSNPRVIHRDFKSSNVLLGDDFTPKVSDFGLAKEATQGSGHISTRVMGTFGYVAPEYAMTGHLLVKSDVYSYGVVLLELLSGRKPVDMSRPCGQENLVTWARPLLTTKDSLKQLVDPALSKNCSFDDVAKVASIASMCVHPEVTHRPFMGEVVQALKLIYDDTGETVCSRRESSSDRESEFGWLSPCRRDSYITMEKWPGSLDEVEGGGLDGAGGNRSGPLRMVRSKPGLYWFRGSKSEHGSLLPRARFWDDEHLV